MDKAQLEACARYIVERNLTNNVEAVAIEWMATEERLDLTYYTCDVPLEDDGEWCEIAMTELLAKFPQIRAANTHMVNAAAHGLVLREGMQFVYRRKAESEPLFLSEQTIAARKHPGG
jgi:hypothetical protein